MARTKKQARRRGSKPAPRAKRKVVKKAAKKPAKKTTARAARKAGAKKASRRGAVARGAKATKRATKPSRRPARVAARKRAAAKPSRPSKPASSARSKSPTPAAQPQPKKAASARPVPVARRAPTLDRERRVVRGDDIVPTPPSSLNLDRSPSAARSGRHEYAEKLREHTSTGPALTAGDIDADWEDAESVGDEAPGGDNPTPDQDVVDEIGKALGITYEDNEELKGGEELAERDRHRWELDPASREDEES
jgi:hypothetical protein